ncbi:MAG: hypothetical protein CM15mP83_3690 [Flavobacteriaceae bacterium]|nr:MAG: hypothetical protein CM15mP83_3690 [Flavobacteriaceae bacterium]
MMVFVSLAPMLKLLLPNLLLTLSCANPEPESNGSFEIRNATGCGVVVAQDLLDTNVITQS